MTEPGGAGEHQDREPIAKLFACRCGPRCLIAAAAKHDDEQDCSAGDDLAPNGATADGNDRTAHSSQNTSASDAEAALEGESVAARRVGWGFITLYTLAYISTSLLFLAPLLVTLALKVNSLVGTEQAPNSLSLVAGVAALLAMFANPFFGRLSDRTSSPWGMRRPWMVIGLLGGSLGVLIVAVAPNIPTVLVGWCIAQVFLNGLLAALVAVLPDQVPLAQR
ncbi:MAG TPA: MFS transporter, partial [Candidatus Limnocylindria bacterium]|nr:MFS transporter [Candidatus Limnocylindria bacterium]